MLINVFESITFDPKVSFARPRCLGSASSSEWSGESVVCQTREMSDVPGGQ